MSLGGQCTEESRRFEPCRRHALDSKKLSRLGTERFRDRDDGGERGIPLVVLDPREVPPAQPGTVGELLQVPPESLSSSANFCAQPHAGEPALLGVPLATNDRVRSIER